MIFFTRFLFINLESIWFSYSIDMLMYFRIWFFIFFTEIFILKIVG